jgi:hypothetical protein
MKKALFLALTVLLLSLLLGACGPAKVENLQPIKFQYTVHHQYVDKLDCTAYLHAALHIS